VGKVPPLIMDDICSSLLLHSCYIHSFFVLIFFYCFAITDIVQICLFVIVLYLPSDLLSVDCPSERKFLPRVLKRN
jgi:hypothetical protein